VTGRPDRVERNWAAILDLARDDGRITGAAVVELAKMAAVGLVEKRDGGWYRLPCAPKAFVPYVCGDCGTWICRTCGHLRYWVNRRYVGIHRCPRCTSTEGEMNDSVHRRVPTGKRHRPVSHPDFAAERLADALNNLERSNSSYLTIAGSRLVRDRRLEIPGTPVAVVWDHRLLTWVARGVPVSDTDGSVNLK
jgi:hypothetical protein